MAYDVTLEVKIDAGSGFGAPQTGNVSALVGNVVQLTAASKAGWPASPPPAWRLYDYPDGLATPAGWTSAADDAGKPTLQYLGSSDPPPFTIGPWGKYKTELLVANEVNDRRTLVNVLASSGLEDMCAEEEGQSHGAKEQWVGGYKRNLRIIDAGVSPTPPDLSSADWYLAPSTGNDTNAGTDAGHPLKTFTEFTRRVVRYFTQATNGITLHVLEPLTGQVHLLADWGFPFGSIAPPPAIVIDGSSAMTTIAASETIEGRVLADGPTNVAYQITVNGLDFTTHVGQLCILLTGANAGASFWITKALSFSLGVGTAQISQPLDADDSPVDVAATDTFKIVSLVKFSDALTVTGLGNIGFSYLQLGDGATQHSVLFAGSTAFVDHCNMYDCDAQNDGPVAVNNCCFTGTPRSYSARLEVTGGMSLGSPIAHEGGLLYFFNHSIKGGGIRSGDGVGQYIFDGSWIRIDDAPGIAVDLQAGWVAKGSAIIMGAGTLGDPTMNVAAGAHYFYSAIPRITGGAHQINVGLTHKNFADLPYVEITNLASAVPA
jgi:hypothetical protein